MAINFAWKLFYRISCDLIQATLWLLAGRIKMKYTLSTVRNLILPNSFPPNLANNFTYDFYLSLFNPKKNKPKITAPHFSTLTIYSPTSFVRSKCAILFHRAVVHLRAFFHKRTVIYSNIFRSIPALSIGAPKSARINSFFVLPLSRSFSIPPLSSALFPRARISSPARAVLYFRSLYVAQR